MCLAGLLSQLEARGVSHAVLEARNPTLDARDIAAVRAFRASHVIGHEIRVDHGYPSRQPLLWVPDIVAGAVGADATGESSSAGRLLPVLTEHRVVLG